MKIKVMQILPLQEGATSKGNWIKQEFVGITDSQYPKSVCFTIFGNKVKTPLVGSKVDIEFNPESREYNGKWYTTLLVWKITMINEGQTLTNHAATNNNLPKQDEAIDDLPF